MLEILIDLLQRLPYLAAASLILMIYVLVVVSLLKSIIEDVKKG